jgi:hypothetical protein
MNFFGIRYGQQSVLGGLHGEVIEFILLSISILQNERLSFSGIFQLIETHNDIFSACRNIGKRHKKGVKNNYNP